MNQEIYRLLRGRSKVVDFDDKIEGGSTPISVGNFISSPNWVGRYRRQETLLCEISHVDLPYPVVSDNTGEIFRPLDYSLNFNRFLVNPDGSRGNYMVPDTAYGETASMAFSQFGNEHLPAQVFLLHYKQHVDPHLQFELQISAGFSIKGYSDTPRFYQFENLEFPAGGKGDFYAHRVNAEPKCGFTFRIGPPL